MGGKFPKIFKGGNHYIVVMKRKLRVMVNSSTNYNKTKQSLLTSNYLT